jgi:hypothetical protein
MSIFRITMEFLQNNECKLGCLNKIALLDENFRKWVGADMIERLPEDVKIHRLYLACS